MNNNTYTIAGINFILKTDLELDEGVEVSKLMTRLYAESPNTITGKFTGEEMKRFLQLVLSPADNRSLPENFSFGKTKESVQVEVFKDFFLDRLRKAGNIANDLTNSIKQQPQP